MPKGAKNFVCGPDFGASPFLTLGPRGFLVWGFAFGGLGLYWAPRCLDPALKQGTTKCLGPRSLGPQFLNFGAYNVSEDLGLFGALR
jgi:hypothetical protein